MIENIYYKSMKWLYDLKYVRVKELCNKYNFKEILNFEIETLKSILFARIFNVRALTLLNVLVPCENLQISLLLVLRLWILKFLEYNCEIDNRRILCWNFYI